MTASLLWLWLEVVRPSWLSFLAAPFVLAGYWLLGRRRREGWWFVIASQAGLLAIGLADRQYGCSSCSCSSGRRSGTGGAGDGRRERGRERRGRAWRALGQRPDPGSVSRNARAASMR